MKEFTAIFIFLASIAIGTYMYWISPNVSAGNIQEQEYVLHCPEIPQPNISLACPVPICNMECPECHEPEMPLFVKESKNVAEANYYEKNRYVCQHFAKELFRRLEADGYEPQYCIGIAEWCVNEGNPESACWHAWVKFGGNILIEATTGEFVLPKDQLMYDERRCYNDLPE